MHNINTNLSNHGDTFLSSSLIHDMETFNILLILKESTKLDRIFQGMQAAYL